MAQERFDFPSKDINDYDDEYDGLDDFSDDYDDDERYPYSNSIQTERDGRRGNSFSYSGSVHSNEINEDNRKDHHNQLERKRRASIKSSYTELREAIPALRNNKASRSVILQKAVDYLDELNRRHADHVSCVDHFSSENSTLEAKCRDVENQVQMILCQRQNGLSSSLSGGSTSQTFNITLPPRSSFRTRDEEDSNDLTSGSTNSTPTASTSRSITSSTSVSTNKTNEASVSTFPAVLSSTSQPSVDDRVVSPVVDNGRRGESMSTNSSSMEYFDDLEEVVAPKKSRKE